MGRCYMRYLNDSIGRTGTLWKGRYKASLVEDDHYVMTCYRYIELNPVRAGMVAEPADYRWSSYRANGLGQHDPLVDPHERSPTSFRRRSRNTSGTTESHLTLC